MFGDSDQSIDAGDSSLPESINPNNFPAKLWRLVNNPVNEAIRWDRNGLVIVIDQRLFEEQILSPSNSSSSSSSALDNKDTFKTTNFSSFVRQLNLYGFKKADDNMRDCCHADQVQFHYFYHANFKRNHPELVASLRRLTVLNKAKIQAGLEVKNRGPSRYLRYSDEGRDKDVKREFAGDYSLLSHTHKESTHPYPPNRAQAAPPYYGTPVPPRLPMRGHGAAPSSSDFTGNKGIPVSLSPNYTGAATSSNAMLLPQGLLACSNCWNPNSPYNVQYPPGYYCPLYACYHQNLVASQMASSGLQNSSSPTQCHHQIADEVMQTQPNSSLIRVVTPDMRGPLSVPLSAHNNNPANTTKANYFSSGNITTSKIDSAYLFAQRELSVNSQPEEMLKDAILEVTIDDVKD